MGMILSEWANWPEEAVITPEFERATRHHLLANIRYDEMLASGYTSQELEEQMDKVEGFWKEVLQVMKKLGIPQPETNLSKLTREAKERKVVVAPPKTAPAKPWMI